MSWRYTTCKEVFYLQNKNSSQVYSLAKKEKNISSEQMEIVPQSDPLLDGLDRGWNQQIHAPPREREIRTCSNHSPQKNVESISLKKPNHRVDVALFPQNSCNVHTAILHKMHSIASETLIVIIRSTTRRRSELVLQFSSTARMTSYTYPSKETFQYALDKQESECTNL